METIPNRDIKLIETNNNSSLLISPSNQNHQHNLYPNGVSDWDNSDSESGMNDMNGNSDEAESYQTHF